MLNEETELTIIEGADTVYISIELTLPPRFLCAKAAAMAADMPSDNTTDADSPDDGDNAGNDTTDSCVIMIMVSVSTNIDDFKCLGSDDFIPRFVVGGMGPVDDGIVVPCGVRVTDENWLQTLVIPVKAKVDALFTVDYTRTLTLHWQSIIMAEVVYTGVVTSFEVINESS